MSRSDTSNAKNFKDLLKLAVLEESGDDLLYFKKFGKSAILAANTPEDVWTVGGDRVLQFENRTISIVSTSVEDASGGTGAFVLAVQGVDENYNIIKDAVFLTGTTPVITNIPFMRVERMFISDPTGSTKSNVGTITATETTGSSVQAQIEATRGQTQMAHLTVPAGYTGLVTFSMAPAYRSSGSGIKRGEIDIHGVTSNQTHYKLYTFGLSNDGTSVFSANFDLPFFINETDEIHFTFNAESAATLVSIVFDVLLVKGLWGTNENFLL